MLEVDSKCVLEVLRWVSELVSGSAGWLSGTGMLHWEMPEYGCECNRSRPDRGGESVSRTQRGQEEERREEISRNGRQGQGGQWWVPTCVGPLGSSDSWEETVQ